MAGSGTTVAVSLRVVLWNPRLTLAVSTTLAGFAPGAGRVTSPVGVITDRFDDVHVIVVSPEPVVGRVRCPRTSSMFGTDNASAALFTSAKISHLALLPQGQPEALARVRAMVDRMDAEGFGACSNEGECEATCPKEISIAGIARMNRQYAKAVLTGAGEKKAAASGD